MKSDIENRGDLVRLLENFYSVAMHDEKIGYFFTEVVKLDLHTHLPVIADFWEKILFGTPVYFGNPLGVHQKMHQQSPLLKEHFERWVEIFRGTVDHLSAGKFAETAKLRAEVIAVSLWRRLNEDTTLPLSRAAS